MNKAQRSFSGGEIDPALYARTDVARYQTSLRQCRNWIVQKHGGVTNRPGTLFIGETKLADLPVRLFKFVLNDVVTNTYVMEFGDFYVRFYQFGARITVSGVAAWANATVYTVGDLVVEGGVNYYCKVAHTSATGTNKPGVDASAPTYWHTLESNIYEIPSPYAAGDLTSIQMVQHKNTITMVHPSYPIQELNRVSSTRWTLAAMTIGPDVGSPQNVNATGGVAGNDTYYAVTAVREGTFEESLPGTFLYSAFEPASGTPVDVTWSPVQGAISYNVYRSTDGSTYGLIGSSGGTLLPRTDTSWTDNNEVASSNVPGSYVAAAGQCRNPLGSISATAKAYDGKYTVKFRTTLTSGAASVGMTQGRVAVYYQRNTDGARIFFAYVNTNTFSMGAFDANKTIGPNPFSFVVEVPDNGYTTLQIDLVPEVNPAAGGSTCTMTVDTSASPDNSVAWTENSVAFSDPDITADTAIGPPSQPNIFSSVNNYPGVITQFQQRRIFAATNTDPGKVWTSRIGSPRSFAFSTPSQADDPISFEIESSKGLTVRHLLDLRKLISFTDIVEFIVDGERDSGILRPDSINARAHSYNGASRLPPIVVNDQSLYVHARNNSVRLMRDDPQESMGADFTLFAGHLFQGYTLSSWDFAAQPFGVVWLVRSDGTLLGLTYIPELDIWGWHRHDTDGAIESVCTVPENSEDALYVVARRFVDGATVRYVERMQTRFFTDLTDAWFVDAGVRIDGTNTTAQTMTLTGGVNWDNLETLTLTSSIPYFAAGDVGDSIWFLTNGVPLEFSIEGFSSNTVVTGRPRATVDVALRGVATTAWARARRVITGLAHLEDKLVSVFADRYVVASPNNSVEDLPEYTVNAGQITLAEPYIRVLVGLPITADVELLDIDSVAQTVKNRRSIVTKVIAFLKSTLGLWYGHSSGPTEADPLAHLQEMKYRDEEDFFDPIAMFTGSQEIPVESRYNDNGRVFIRQVDPLPATILMVAPDFGDS